MTRRGNAALEPVIVRVLCGGGADRDVDARRAEGAAYSTRLAHGALGGLSYLGVPRSTFDTWVRGYVRHPAGRKPVRGAQLLTSVPGGHLTIPFIGLAEGMVLAAFRETGLPLQRIRPALERLDKEFGLEHALASENLFTDGAELLFDYARSHGDKQLRLLTVVRSGQRVFHEVIEHYLTRIDYETGWAARLKLPITDEPLLIADPDRAFGQPIFIHGGARLADVVGRIRAGEDAAVVVNDYGVPLQDVHAALAAPGIVTGAHSGRRHLLPSSM